MNRTTIFCAALANLALTLCAGAFGAVGAAEETALKKTADWRSPEFDEVKSQVLDWIHAESSDAAIRTRAEALWAALPASSSSAVLLDRVAETFAMVDPKAAALVELCQASPGSPTKPDLAWLDAPETPAFEAHNLRLLYARWLAAEQMYDESQAQLVGLRPDDVVDPAGLLFYRAVAAHRLLDRDTALDAISELMDGAASSPDRYIAVARLMRGDIKDLEEDSLDHIARRMEDVGRRLDLGRAGPTVRKIEDGVIDSLDKLIKDMQDQQQQASAGGNSLQSSKPASDSQILGGKGPGDVTKRDIGSQSGWGNLPPKEREQAMQEISREFPSHYRDAIEQYFRRLAGQRSEGE